jgi:hypothetical protein
MATYASAEEIELELSDWPELALPSGDALERLILRAEACVDLRIGPGPRDPITGRKCDPLLLAPAQADALLQATAIAVAHLAEGGLEALAGTDDLLPALLTRLPGGGLATQIDQALSGLDLIARSGTVLPDDDLVA